MEQYNTTFKEIGMQINWFHQESNKFMNDIYLLIGLPVHIKWKIGTSNGVEVNIPEYACYDDEYYSTWHWFHIISLSKNRQKLKIIGIPDPTSPPNNPSIWEGDPFKVKLSEIEEILSYKDGIRYETALAKKEMS